MKVLVNYFEKNNLLKTNTDLNYPKIFELLSYLNCNIIFNDSSVSFYRHFFYYALRNYSSRLKINIYDNDFFYKKLKTVYIPARLTKNIDLCFSHGHYPIGLKEKGIPVLVNTGFMTNKYSGVKKDEERMAEVKKLFALSKLATIVTFNSQDAIDRYCAFEPRLKNKLRVAPYMIKPILPMTEKDIYDKNNSDKIRICFVGTQGIRKGLSNFLKSN